MVAGNLKIDGGFIIYYSPDRYLKGPKV